MRGIDGKSGENLNLGCRGNRGKPGTCRDFRARARRTSSRRALSAEANVGFLADDEVVRVELQLDGGDAVLLLRPPARSFAASALMRHAVGLDVMISSTLSRKDRVATDQFLETALKGNTAHTTLN